MELPSFFYMTAICERVNLLTDIAKNSQAYSDLEHLGCLFYDAYIVHDPKTDVQLELDRYFVPHIAHTDAKRVQEIMDAYMRLIVYLSEVNPKTNCFALFNQLANIRLAFYQQIIRERVVSGLPVYWRNMSGWWKAICKDIRMPWATFDIFSTGGLNKNNFVKQEHARLDRAHFYLSIDDMANDRPTLLDCERHFEQLKKEVQGIG